VGEQAVEDAESNEDEKENENGDGNEDKNDEEVPAEACVELPPAAVLVEEVVVEVAAAVQPAAPVMEAPVMEAPVEAAGSGATYTLEQLTGGDIPNGVDAAAKELYLSDAEFEAVFKVDKEAWAKLPKWKRVQVGRREYVCCWTDYPVNATHHHNWLHILWHPAFITIHSLTRLLTCSFTCSLVVPYSLCAGEEVQRVILKCVRLNHTKTSLVPRNLCKIDLGAPEAR
jgi:hypothetical protein